jgi:hypothetical protein
MVKFVLKKTVMNEQVDNSIEIKYDNVSLAELKAVVAIYKKVEPRVFFDNNLFQNNAILLTENFGLPLVFVKYGK